MTQLAGKNVLITGAAAGLGRLMALEIAARGGKIIGWDIDEAGLTALQSHLEAQGRPVATYVCDLSDRDAIYATADRVIDDHGGVDVLINNAGVVTGKSLLEASDRAIELTMQVNTMALFWTTRKFLPGMLERGHGHVVTVASAAGIVGTPKLADYCASKFAAVGFDESLRLEMLRNGHAIKTTVVCPYYIDTGMFAGVKTRFPWLLPIMKPEYVVGRIMKAIEKDRPRVIEPPFVHAVFPVRLLPVRFFDFLMGFFGINRSMDEFTGRNNAH